MRVGAGATRIAGLEWELAQRVDAIDWERVSQELDDRGNAVMDRLLSPAECAALTTLYARDGISRSRVVMERHAYGRGEYRYFS